MDPTRSPLDPSECFDPADEALPPPPWRRPLLVFAGSSLLTAGVVLNAARLGLTAPEVVARAHATAGSTSGGSGLRSAGEEGKMGRASTTSHGGLYAMKGPEDPAPERARRFEPDVQARKAGILGRMRQESGHFLAAPDGAAFSVAEVGARDRQVEIAGFVETRSDAKSTFSIDVDTAAYANVRRHLQDGLSPPLDAVRTEEFLNYFDYDYPDPVGEAPFSVTTEVGPAPWNDAHRIVHVGLRGERVDASEVPPRNLVFLIDVSGSMSGPDRLGLIQGGLAALVERMTARDRISLVAYAGGAGIVLPPTSGADHRAIIDALQRLQSGGSTNGAEGIHLAYDLARRSFIHGGINRVLIATDGDFNVGVRDDASLVELIEAERESGVFLSVLGVGMGNYDDRIMEQLADRGNGNYAYIDGEREAQKVLVEESEAMLHTIAEDVKIQVEFDPDQVSAHRLIGYENRGLAHHDFDDDTKDAGELGAGHTVTALYEVIPAPGAGDDPLMTLNLRYARPDGAHSQKVSVAVRDDDRALADTSTDYRFSAAVAMFGQKLRGSEVQAGTTFAEIARMALGAVGSDPHCDRHEFVALAIRAGTLAGEAVDVSVPTCRVKPPLQRPFARAPTDPIEESQDEPFDWGAFFIEVLRLLPPLLAMPVFAMAFWRPRRRARLE